MTNYSPYFDQEEPQVSIVGLIAELSLSEEYKLNTTAVFKTTHNGYLVVEVRGCSCWPDNGSTKQTSCPRLVDVDRVLTGRWRPLLDTCQARGWRPAPGE